MKTKMITIVAAVMILPASQVQAIDIDFYSDATIQDDAIYNMVRIYDTPPEITTVDMYGGSVNSFRTYDTSTLNIYGGRVLGEIIAGNSSAVNIYGGSVTCHSLAVMDLSTLNIYGGNFSSANSPYFSSSSTVNIYGYDFERGIRSLTGLLSDGSSFIFRELFSDEYLHMNLIVVPEPISAEIDIQPDTLNISSEGRWISCRIQFPEDCNAADINPDSVLLEGRVKADSISFSEQQQVATARFNRSEVQGILEVGEVELTVTGHLVDGTYFDGTDTIKVIDKGHKND